MFKSAKSLHFSQRCAAPGEDKRTAADNGLQRGVRGSCHGMAIQVVHVILQRAVPVACGHRQRLSRVQQPMLDWFCSCPKAVCTL